MASCNPNKYNKFECNIKTNEQIYKQSMKILQDFLAKCPGYHLLNLDHNKIVALNSYVKTKYLWSAKVRKLKGNNTPDIFVNLEELPFFSEAFIIMAKKKQYKPKFKLIKKVQGLPAVNFIVRFRKLI